MLCWRREVTPTAAQPAGSLSQTSSLALLPSLLSAGITHFVAQPSQPANRAEQEGVVSSSLRVNIFIWEVMRT